MTRRPRSSALAVIAVLLPLAGSVACEDPIIIVGDLPGIMHRAAGVPNLIGSDLERFCPVASMTKRKRKS